MGSPGPCNCDQALALQESLTRIKKCVEGAKLSFDDYITSKDGDSAHLAEAYSAIKRAIAEFRKLESPAFTDQVAVPPYENSSLWEPWK